MVSWGSMGNWGSSVCWGSLVGDISDITIIVISVILDVLDSAVGKVDGVFTIDNTSSVIVLSLLESSNSICVRVWGNLSKVISNISGLHWGMVSRGSMSNNWGSMDGMVNWGMDSVRENWGSMDSMVNWGMDSVRKNWGSMDSMVNWGMDSVNSMGDNSISTVKSVGGISNNSSVGSESLALCCASVFHGVH